MQHPQKFIIAGTSGAGKTTLARALSKKLGLPCTDLDDLYWLPGWEKRCEDDFWLRVQKTVSTKSWVLCGNNSRVRCEIWKQADMIIWLDLPLATCLFRAGKRSLKTWLKHTSVCNGNYETLGRIFGKNSILLWVYQSHSKRRKEYTRYFEANAHSAQTLVRLTNRKEVREFIKYV